MSESDAVGPQVSFFYETIKVGFYMKLLKNGLYFNSVWGQSLNLSHSPPDGKKNHTISGLRRWLCLCAYVCVWVSISTCTPVARNPIKHKSFT